MAISCEILGLCKEVGSNKEQERKSWHDIDFTTPSIQLLTKLKLFTSSLPNQAEQEPKEITFPRDVKLLRQFYGHQRFLWL